MASTTVTVPVNVKTSPTIAIGLATKTGLGTAALNFLAAILSYTTGDQSQAELGTIVFTAAALIALLAVIGGRYLQSNTLLKRDAGHLLSVGEPILSATEHPGLIAQAEAAAERVAKAEIAKVLPAKDVPIAEEAATDVGADAKSLIGIAGQGPATLDLTVLRTQEAAAEAVPAATI
jgi:hypothetical protein